MSSPKIFLSYSHRDRGWAERLLTHLKVFERENLIDAWDDRRILAGTVWRSEIQEAIDSAAIGILMISADFLASDFIRGEEIPRMLERRSKSGMRLFPVIIRSCEWQIVEWLEEIQIRPVGARPLADLRGNKRDAELTNIVREIRLLLSLKQGSSGLVPLAPALPSFLPALHQLPSNLVDLVGRDRDLSHLKIALARGGTGTIFGLEGVGKTELALKLAQELTPLYPDAQIFLDMRGLDPHTLTVTDAMAYTVRSFYPGSRIPVDRSELAPLYRSCLYGKRCLLLLDNANREHVESLAPPFGSLLLATSRIRFSFPGLVSMDLNELSEEDAYSLLLRIAPGLAPIASEIARFCGLPGSLQLVGSALVERQSLSKVAQELSVEAAMPNLGQSHSGRER